MQVFGSHDDSTRAQLARVAQRARKVALMADGHAGYVMPIGGVAAYTNAVSIVGVGFDIEGSRSAILVLDNPVRDRIDTSPSFSSRTGCRLLARESFR
jgi:RNA-splicing ligase RtcB